MDKGSLFSLALTYLGERSYVAGSPSAEACDLVAQHCIGLALDYTSWTFAMAMTFLDLSSGSARLPDDCLRMISLDVARFERMGNVIYSDDHREAVELRYMSNIMVQSVALPDDEPSFCEGVALLLAAKVAPRLVSNANVAVAMEQAAWQMLSRAKLKDAQQVDSNDQSPGAHSAAYARDLHPIYLS